MLRFLADFGFFFTPNKMINLIFIISVLPAFVLTAGVTRGADELHVLKSQPDWLKKCRRSDPNLNDCLKDSFTYMFPALARGIPELAVAPFEPLYIDKVALSRGNGGVAIRGAFSHLYAHGPSNSTTDFVRVDFNKKTYSCGVSIPSLRVTADYAVEGNILLLPIVGQGGARLNLRNVTTTAECEMDFRKLDGEEVMWLKNIKVDFIVGELRIQLDNLFNGNKILGRTVNMFLNKNSIDVLTELRPDLQEALGEVFLPIMRRAFSQIPVRFWLTED